jgi:alpha-ketoglutarate-dependent taurine dioxygenase
MNDSLTVNYAPPFQGPLELPAEEMKAFYGALKKFAGYIERPDLQFRHTMRPGQCMLFANRRVLHARTAFDPTKGKRHLKGCYVDLDMVKDKYRTSVQAKDEGAF